MANNQNLESSINMRIGNNISVDTISKNTALRQLLSVGGLTFLHDNNFTSLDASYSLGSPTATFTASRDASTPATYIDANGVIQVVTTANTGRETRGYYDETGFHLQRGLMIEGERTNYLTRTDGTAYSGGLWTGWSIDDNSTNPETKTQEDQTVLNIAGAKAQRVNNSFTNGSYSFFIAPPTAVGSVTPGDTFTYSVLVKGSLTNISSVKLEIREFDSSSVVGTNNASADLKSSISSTQWTKLDFTVTLDDADVSLARPYVFISWSGTGSYDLQIMAPQLEKGPYATSYIPTTTAALTRNGEVYKFATAGNRTAAAETIFIKFIPFGSFANDGLNRCLIKNDTDTRSIFKYRTIDKILSTANESDPAGGIQLQSSTVPLSNISYVTASVVKHSAPYLSSYVNGGDIRNENATDFTTNTFGTYFYIGSNSGGVEQLNGLIQAAAFYQRALTAAEVLQASTIMANMS